MRRRYQLKNSKLLKQMLAGPYLLWSAAFIIIPLIMVFYYGLTNNDGGFTMMNLARITRHWDWHFCYPLSVRLSA